MRLRRRPLPQVLARPLAARPAETLHIALPEQLGALVFAPALFAFMAWLIRHPALPRLDRLYFASREGWLLEQLYRAMRARAGTGSLPHGIYLPCSRRALLAAQLGRMARNGGRLDTGLLTASSRWFEGSVEELLLARIGFAPRLPAAAGARRITLMQDADVVHCVADLLEGEIAPEMRRRHADFVSFARGCGLTGGGGAGLVDVGYSATIQSAIQHVLGIRLVGFYMAVTEAAAKVRAQGGYAFGAFARGEEAAGFGGAFGLLLEAVLTAPHGQVIGYRRRGFRRRAEPVHDPDRSRQVRFGLVERVHAGILSACLERLAGHGLQPEADPLAMLRRLGQGTVSVSADIREILRVEDAFCGNGEIDVLGRMSARDAG